VSDAASVPFPDTRIRGFADIRGGDVASCRRILALQLVEFLTADRPDCIQFDPDVLLADTDRTNNRVTITESD